MTGNYIDLPASGSEKERYPTIMDHLGAVPRLKRNTKAGHNTWAAGPCGCLENMNLDMALFFSGTISYKSFRCTLCITAVAVGIRLALGYPGASRVPVGTWKLELTSEG